MTTRLFIIIAFFISCCFSSPVFAKNVSGNASSMEQIKQAVFKNVKTQISTSGFPQTDPKRSENLYALQSLPIIDDRTVIYIDQGHYMVSFNSGPNYNKSYIFRFDGTLAYVDFIIYPSCIKSFEDFENQEDNDKKTYPYYVYRHDNNGYFNGAWYVVSSFAYFFDAGRNLRYKCNQIKCTDVRTGNNLGLRYYY